MAKQLLSEKALLEILKEMKQSFTTADFAEKFKEKCVAEGGDAEECAKAAERLENACKHKLAWICHVREGRRRAPLPFRRGDLNLDDRVDLGDCVNLLMGLFRGRHEALRCEDAADANDDGVIDLSDAISVLRHLFLGTGPLPAPGGRRGQDPTADSLMCEP